MIDRKIIKGKVLVDNKWIKKEVSIPLFIDTSPYCFNHKREIQFLREHSMLSTTKLGSKDTVYKKIIEDGDFASFIIPTHDFSNFKDLYTFLRKHKQIIIKPKNGLKGKGIYSLSINRKRKFILTHQNKEEIISKRQLKNFVTNDLNTRKHILQKYLYSKTLSGDPFDCRIRLEKNGRGEWEVAIFLVRIGSNQKVVSNVAQGGSVSRLTPFLKANYHDQAETIKKSIKDFANTFPYKVEELFHHNLTSLGLDIGISPNGELFLFEVETGPGFEFALGELALVKSEYYKYILNKLSQS